MNIQKVSILVIMTALLCGCSSIKYTEYHGTEVLQGPVGTPRDVEGVEFWDNGIPARKYKILGTLASGSKKRMPLGRLTQGFSGSDDKDDREAAIAKAAHKHGGDGVVLVRGGSGPSDAGDSGGRRHQRLLLVVVKYME
jgi:hypothetical protein